VNFPWDFGDEPSCEERQIDLAYTLEGRAILLEIAELATADEGPLPIKLAVQQMFPAPISS
jgi:hypothetical protein